MEFRDEVWKIETAGIEAVPADRRHGRAGELFWIWFAANIGILALVSGAIIASFQLDFWQGLLVTALAGLSFWFVGYFGLAGPATGVPMLTLSRASFGVKGAFLPTLISWINLIGWETVAWVTAALAGVELFAGLGFHPGLTLSLILFFAIGIIIYAFGAYGHATVARVQFIASLLFGLLTMLLTAYLLLTHHVAGVNFAKPAPLLAAFLPALAFTLMFSGLSWLNCAADYTRYMPAGTSRRKIVWLTVFGSSIPLVILVMAGYLLSTRIPQLATSSNPLLLLSRGIPAYLMVPFWIVGIAGLLPECVLAIYSSGLNLLAMGVKLPRYKTVYIDFVLSGALGAAVIISRASFMGVMETFLSVVVALMAPFAAVILTDLLWQKRLPFQVNDLYNPTGGTYHSAPGFRGGFGIPALVSYLLGLATIFLCGAFFLPSGAPFFSGPLTIPFFQSSQMVFIFAFLLTLAVYNVWKGILYGGRSRAGVATPAASRPA